MVAGLAAGEYVQQLGSPADLLPLGHGVPQPYLTGQLAPEGAGEPVDRSRQRSRRIDQVQERVLDRRMRRIAVCVGWVVDTCDQMDPHSGYRSDPAGGGDGNVDQPEGL